MVIDKNLKAIQRLKSQILIKLQGKLKPCISSLKLNKNIVFDKHVLSGHLSIPY